MQIYSPSGEPIQHVYEDMIGVCGVEFTALDEWDHDDQGTDVDFGTSETVMARGEVIFVDSGSNEWLRHHLVERDCGLSPETRDLMGRELRMLWALDRLDEAHKIIRRMVAAGELPLPISRGGEALLEQMYLEIKAKVLELKARDIAAWPPEEDEDDQGDDGPFVPHIGDEEDDDDATDA